MRVAPSSMRSIVALRTSSLTLSWSLIALLTPSIVTAGRPRLMQLQWAAVLQRPARPQLGEYFGLDEKWV